MKDIISGDFLQVLLSLENKTKRDIKVASLGIVESINTDDNTAEVKIIPKATDESEYKLITAYALNDINQDSENPDISKGDLVVLLFLDKNFIYNLRKYKTTGRESDLVSVDETNYHSEKYAIMIKTF